MNASKTKSQKCVFCEKPGATMNKIHKHLCSVCGCLIIEGPMECPEFQYQDHLYGRCDQCRDKQQKGPGLRGESIMAVNPVNRLRCACGHMRIQHKSIIAYLSCRYWKLCGCQGFREMTVAERKEWLISTRPTH